MVRQHHDQKRVFGYEFAFDRESQAAQSVLNSFVLSHLFLHLANQPTLSPIGPSFQKFSMLAIRMFMRGAVLNIRTSVTVVNMVVHEDGLAMYSRFVYPRKARTRFLDMLRVFGSVYTV